MCLHDQNNEVGGKEKRKLVAKARVTRTYIVDNGTYTRQCNTDILKSKLKKAERMLIWRKNSKIPLSGNQAYEKSLKKFDF